MLVGGVPYIKKQIKYNITPKTRTMADIKAIVIHYTANYKKGAGMLNHFNYWNTGNRKSSCDIVIDDHTIGQINDWFKYYTWQIGDGKGKYGYLNSNVIGIEMCVNSDGDFNKTVENTIACIRYLFSLGYTKNVIRHYDASRKLCPEMFVDLNIKGWNKAYINFRNKVFADDETELYKNYKNLLWLYEKGFITGKNYMSDKDHLFFNCDQIAIILKRMYDNILNEVAK